MLLQIPFYVSTHTHTHTHTHTLVLYSDILLKSENTESDFFSITSVWSYCLINSAFSPLYILRHFIMDLC